MTASARKVRVAVVQAASVMFDREATVEKAVGLIAEAAAGGARLVVFPEALVPAYPRGLSFGSIVGNRSDEGRRIYARYLNNAVVIPSPATDRLGQAVREAGVWLAIGVIEREPAGGTLYCTLLYFGPDGAILGKHRKLKPTASERLIWGEGDGSTMPVLETKIGRIGGLICWENYMPLARAALYQKGIELYLAPTADARERWQATMRHVALEGRCFVLACNQYTTKSMYPTDLGPEALSDLEQQPEVLCRGGSAIISPLGDYLAGPLYDGEGILYADLDHDDLAASRFDFDPVGHYARPDVFTLTLDETARW